MIATRGAIPWIRLVLAGALALAGGAPALGQHAGGHGGAPMGGGARPAAPMGGAHQHLDTRFSHNQYYYDRGYSLRKPPTGGGEFRGPDGGRYWFDNGNWYRWSAGRWVVWGAPIGVFIPFLPPFYTPFWWYGVLYYYANDTYYLWDDTQQEYEVVPPPEGVDASDATATPTSDRLFVYPKSGQSSDQQAKDQYECHQWAVQQSGYDPTIPGATGTSAPSGPADAAKRSDYLRAKMSCLVGRGYSVR